jgi:hypothetical protein
VIAQYLADRAGTTTLMPAPGTLERYRVLEWQNYITSELHKSFTPLFHADLEASAKQTLAGLLRKKLEWVDGQLAGQGRVLDPAQAVHRPAEPDPPRRPLANHRQGLSLRDRGQRGEESQQPLVLPDGGSASPWPRSEVG